jgi:hypothetical protein
MRVPRACADLSALVAANAFARLAAVVLRESIAMRRFTLIAAFVALVLSAFAPPASADFWSWLGFGGSDNIRRIDVAELDAMLAGGQPLYVYDVNPDDLRAKAGIIPGSILLTSTRNYDLSKLPEDRGAPLVFYCADRR